MVGNNIRSSTGSMTITTALSTGLGNITAVAKGNVSIGCTGSSSVSLTSGTSGSVSLTSGTSINLVPDATAGAILTDSKIATLQGFPTNVGCSVDFFQGNPDNRFTLNKNNLLFNQFFTLPVDKINIIDIKNDIGAGDNYINQIQTDSAANGVQTQNICNLTTQKLFINDNRSGNIKSITIDNNISSTENKMELIQNSGLGVVAQSGITNNAGTQMLSLTHTNNATNKALSLRQDTIGTGKLQYDNTIDNSAFEISSNNTPIILTAFGAITINAGAGNVNAVGTELNFNTINIIPRHTYSSVVFSVMGSPTSHILNFGAITDMTAGTRWKVDVGFYTGDGINNRAVLTYLVQDTTNTDVVLNSVFGYSSGGLQTPITYDPTGTPMGKYCSFTDVVSLNATAVGACSFILTGGTSDSSTWAGTAGISIVLTRLQ
jgi:hypothetical protein